MVCVIPNLAKIKHTIALRRPDKTYLTSASHRAASHAHTGAYHPQQITTGEGIRGRDYQSSSNSHSQISRGMEYRVDSL